jgi:hypothetical protein
MRQRLCIAPFNAREAGLELPADRRLAQPLLDPRAEAAAFARLKR